MLSITSIRKSEPASFRQRRENRSIPKAIACSPKSSSKCSEAMCEGLATENRELQADTWFALQVLRFWVEQRFERCGKMATKQRRLSCGGSRIGCPKRLPCRFQPPASAKGGPLLRLNRRRLIKRC